MEKDDDLGSFFAEINEIEAITTASEQPAATSSSSEVLVEDPPSKRARLEEVTVAAAPVLTAQVIVAKPAEIKTHAVYTYDYGGMENSLTAGAASSAQSFSTASDSAAAYQGLAAYSNPQSSQPAQPVKLRTDEKYVRKVADEVWVDETLKEWPENDYRVFVGDLAKDTTTEQLTKAFQHYPSFAKAKVIKSAHENKSRGYGFVSFLDPMDCAKAIREMNGKYLASR